MSNELLTVDAKQEDMSKTKPFYFRGLQVTTISGIAESLQKTATAINNTFINNKAKFIVDDYYFEISAKELEELRKQYPQIGINTKYLFTEKGFRMLCTLLRSEIGQLVVQDTINKASAFTYFTKLNDFLQELFSKDTHAYTLQVELAKMQTEVINNQTELQKMKEQNRHIEQMKMLEPKEDTKVITEVKTSRRFRSGKDIVVVKGEMMENGVKIFDSPSDAARHLGLSAGHVSQIAGRSKKHFYSVLGVEIRYVDKAEYLSQAG